MELPILNNSAEFREAGGRRRLPPWLRKRLPAGGAMMATRQLLGGLGLATVCTDAHCPNLAECWSRRTATFLVLGRHCTRQCRFCAVGPGSPEPVEADEPARLAEAAAALGLGHVVITSVTRDDLPDEGAGHFARCVAAVRRRLPDAAVEVLTPDFHARRECVAEVLSAGPAVFNHNIETVRRLTPAVRPQADYDRSLAVLRTAGEEFGMRNAERGISEGNRPGCRPVGAGESCAGSLGEAAKRQPAAAGDASGPAVDSSAFRIPHSAFTKSGLMVGLGETTAEILQTLADLRAAGCDIVTIGQYLAPTAASVPVARYYRPEEFDELADAARGLGFASASAGPFVRSSYHAAEAFDNATRGRPDDKPGANR